MASDSLVPHLSFPSLFCLLTQLLLHFPVSVIKADSLLAVLKPFLPAFSICTTKPQTEPPYWMSRMEEALRFRISTQPGVTCSWLSAVRLGGPLCCSPDKDAAPGSFRLHRGEGDRKGGHAVHSMATHHFFPQPVSRNRVTWSQASREGNKVLPVCRSLPQFVLRVFFFSPL